MRLIRLLLLSVSVLFVNLANSHTTNFVGISDVHLNPFDISSHYPSMGEDPNSFFLKRFIGSVAYISTHNKEGNILPQDELPKFIVISGDLLAHDFINKVSKNKDRSICSSDPSSCALTTIDTIIRTIRETQNGIFEHTPIYVALGNNDSDAGNYIVNQAFLPQVAAHIYDYAHPGDGTEIDKATFIQDFSLNEGAYSVTEVGNEPYLNLLSLNTILYANKTNDKGAKILACVNSSKTLDCNTFRTAQNKFISNFITSKMQDPNQRTIAIMHIPPYESGFGFDNSVAPSLDKDFAKQAFTIAGHWHMYSKLNKVNGVMQNSVTYEKGVKPGFLLYDFENNKVSQVKQCRIDDPTKLSGSTIDLNFTCQ